MVAGAPARALVEALEALAREARSGALAPDEVAAARARLLGGAVVADVRAIGPARRGRTLAVARAILAHPDAVAWLEAAVERFDVAIVDAGALDGEEAVHRAALRRRGLSAHALERIRFPAHKPPADLYLDPRAVRFEGGFPDLEALRAMMLARQ